MACDLIGRVGRGAFRDLGGGGGEAFVTDRMIPPLRPARVEARLPEEGGNGVRLALRSGRRPAMRAFPANFPPSGDPAGEDLDPRA